MPRLKNRLPRMFRDRDYAVVKLGNKRHHLGKWGSAVAKVEYDRIVAEWLAAGRPTLKPNNSLSCNQMMLAYLKWAKSYHGEGTDQVASIKALCKSLKPNYGHTPAEEFGPLAFKAWRQTLIEDDKARTYINELGKRLRQMFAWAASEEMIPGAVVENLKQVAALKRGKTNARESIKVGPVSDEVVSATLAELGDLLADMVRVHRLLGCRPTELCEIKPGLIDRTGEIWLYRPSHHKTEDRDKSRIISFPRRASEIISKYIGDEDRYCFESKSGCCYSEGSYRNAIKRAAERAFPLPERWKRRDGESAKAWKSRLADVGEREDMERWRNEHHWSPNRLRHSRATEVRRDFGLEASGATLGHSELATTQIYAERNLQLSIDVARKTQ